MVYLGGDYLHGRPKRFSIDPARGFAHASSYLTERHATRRRDLFQRNPQVFFRVSGQSSPGFPLEACGNDG